MKIILLVDDSATMRRIQRNSLKSSGIDDSTIFEAEDGEQALKFMRDRKPALVLMDWNMPTMTGIDALREAKTDPAIKDIPVIMVTSESEKKRIIEAIQAGADNYVVKPFTPDTILEKVKPHL